MKLSSLPRWAKLSMAIFVALLLVVVGSRGCGSKKPVVKSDRPVAAMGKKPDTKPKPPVTTTTSTLQRIESAITVIQNGLADLTKGLADLNSRVKILEKRLASQATGGTGRSRTSKKAATPTVPKSPPPAPSTTATPTTTAPPPAVAVDLTPVERGLREGLGEIAEAIKETHVQPPASIPDHTAEPLPTIPVSDNPCANWAHDPAKHRRCRLYNQLP